MRRASARSISESRSPDDNWRGHPLRCLGLAAAGKCDDQKARFPDEIRLTPGG